MKHPGVKCAQCVPNLLRLLVVDLHCHPVVCRTSLALDSIALYVTQLISVRTVSLPAYLEIWTLRMEGIPRHIF